MSKKTLWHQKINCFHTIVCLENQYNFTSIFKIISLIENSIINWLNI